MKSKNNITLIGMPAVGKTTVGKQLARQLGLSFMDTDDLIQASQKATLAEIIEKKGLERFLEIEAAQLAGIDCENHVISTGGSAVYSARAMANLARISLIIYLCVDLATLLTRLSDTVSRGVAMTPGKDIRALYKERTPLYDAFSHIRIECSSMTAEEVVQKALTCLSKNTGEIRHG